MGKDIVLITSGWKTSGVYRVENELVEEWKKQGHKISLINANGRIISDINEKKIENKESGIKPIALMQRFIRLRKFFKNHKDATIVALSISADCFAALFGLTIKNKIVLSERNDPAQYPESRVYRCFRNFCFYFADVCVFQTEDAKKYFSKRIQNKGVVIPNPINCNIPHFSRDNVEKIIISTGRLKRQKNFPLLINAFALFSKDFPDYQLNIYGNGDLLDELRSLAKKQHVSEKVRFYEFVDDIWPIMAKASMFVMSSDYEGISNSMLEAMAIGIPTICTDCPVGGARLMIENGVNGLLVPVGDVDALANAMKRIAEDKRLALSLGNNGKKIRGKYPIAEIARRWIEVM